jgi:transcriptional regulator with XRE-family HTH domain
VRPPLMGANLAGQQEWDRWSNAVVTVLRAARDDADVTQAELARRLGWTKAQVVNLEGGRRAVRAVDLFMIAGALRIEPQELIRLIQAWARRPTKGAR